MRLLNTLSLNMDTSGGSRQAAWLIVIGMALIGFGDNLVPFVSDDSSLWQFHAIRGVMVLAALMVASRLGAGAIWPKQPLGVIGRGALQTVAMLIYFGCIVIMPIGVVVAGLFTAPIFVLLIEVIFLGKQVGRYRWAAVALGFIGVLIVIRPDPSALDVLSFLPVLAGAFYAVSAIATRSWCEGEDTLTLAFWFFMTICISGWIGVAVLPVEGSFATRGWQPMSGGMVGWYVVLAGIALVGMSMITRGYQVGEASIAAVFEYSLLVFASFWAWALWSDVVPWTAYAGMALIAAAGAIITLRDDGA